VLTAGPGKKVGIYVAEDQQYHGNSAYAAILDFLFFYGVSGASVTRRIAGFGSDHRLHTTRLLHLATRLPIKVEFIEKAEKVEALLPKLHEMAGSGIPANAETPSLWPTWRGGVPRCRRLGEAQLWRRRRSYSIKAQL
jgi:PII-like signaling protein